jgi:hypothetical protein
MQTPQEAFPIIVQNTFISVDFGESKECYVPRRRCSSLPPMGTKAHDICDSDAVTDVCTDSDELATFSDSGQTTDGEQQEFVKADDPKPQRTRLNPSAAMWSPPAISDIPQPPAPADGVLPWKVGTPPDAAWAQWWQDTATDVVAKMSLALGNIDSVSHVECRQHGAEWTVLAKTKIAGLCQFERIQTVAKRTVLQAAEASQCLYVLGYRGLPFQPTPGGFTVSLASMTNSKNACWDVYKKGFCPRGCACTWEHPGLVQNVTLTIEFTECDK